MNDNIFVTFGGTIFTGKYKIIEIEHSIDDSGFKSTMRLIRTNVGLNGPREVPDDIVSPMSIISELVKEGIENITHGLTEQQKHPAGRRFR